MEEESNPGYILRISQDKWEEQVYRLGKYYPGFHRKWKTGTPILLVKNTDVGDSFIGYGIVDKVEMLWEMPPEEEKYCKDNGWRCALSFTPLIKFEKPVPIKETFLADDKRKGSYLHGIIVGENEVNEIIEAGG